MNNMTNQQTEKYFKLMQKEYAITVVYDEGYWHGLLSDLGISAKEEELATLFFTLYDLRSIYCLQQVGIDV